MNDLTTRLHSKGHKKKSGVRNVCCSCRVSEFRFQYPVVEQNFCISKSSGFILFFWTWKTHVLMCSWVAEACTYIIEHKKASIKSRYNLYFFLEIYMHFQKGVIIPEEAVSVILWTQCICYVLLDWGLV